MRWWISGVALVVVVSAVAWVHMRQHPAWPEGMVVASAPQQHLYPKNTMSDWEHAGARLTPVGHFRVEGRVLGIRSYRNTATSDVLPYDMALGWQAMSDTQVLQHLRIWQGERRYYYRFLSRPVQAVVVGHDSSNMHLIPSSTTVAHTLKRVRINDRVRIDGVLVDVAGSFGRIRTSVSRTDSWDGACEIVWVNSIDILPTPAS